MISTASHMVYIGLSPVLSAVFVVLNVATIHVFCRRFRLNSICTILIVNISLCDIFVCLVSNTVYVYNLTGLKAWQLGLLPCKLFKFLTMLTNVAQIYFLCFLTADRVRRLLKPCIRQWQKREGLKLMCAGWAAALALTAPRLIYFQEVVVKTRPGGVNVSAAVNTACRPRELQEAGYVAATLAQFLLAFLLPTAFILYAAVVTRAFLRRQDRAQSTVTNTVVNKVRNRLALTFNLTAACFLLVWTPFFMLSVVDLAFGLIYRRDLAELNFSLRCTLLVLGSGKPVIYLLCLERFRNCFVMRNAVKPGNCDGQTLPLQKRSASGESKRHPMTLGPLGGSCVATVMSSV